MDTKRIFKSALLKWGIKAQVDILLEEMSELSMALLKARRYPLKMRHNKHRIAEEIADTRIMLDQIEEAMELHDLVEYYQEMKLRRLLKILKDK